MPQINERAGIFRKSTSQSNIVAQSASVGAPSATVSRHADSRTAAERKGSGATTPSPTSGPQFDSYNYGSTLVYGSNVGSAWRDSAGIGVNAGVVDDGFDPITTATFGNFSTALSRAFGSSTIAEPPEGYHGTTVAGVIGASGLYESPEGIAPGATIIGAKVDFSAATIALLAQAEAYAASVSSLVNNSWIFSQYGLGQPNDPNYAAWYATIQQAVATDRGGLGSVLVFSAGNDRQHDSNLALQPTTADYRVIAVAASDPNGLVASYSTPGSALLVAAVGDNVTVVNTGESGGTAIVSGTSYAAPQVSAIVALMLSVNPNLGWRDVQEILADSAYMPPPSASGFTFNGAAQWNGGGMHFSNDLGFGVVDANVAVNLARAWTKQSTSTNLTSTTVADTSAFTVGTNATVSATVQVTAPIRIQHVQITITDTYLPFAASKITLVSPDGTSSVLVNQINATDTENQAGVSDLSGATLTSNAFWGENATGTWTLQIQDIAGQTIGTITSFSLTFLGDRTSASATPLVYTPEFAALAAVSAARTTVTPAGATTIDLIAMPGTTTINLNGGSGYIDGVAVTLTAPLKNANADGDTGTVNLTGLARGGSELTGGDGTSTLTGYGGDTINAGLGSTTIVTGHGGSSVTMSNLAASTVTVTSGGGDIIHAGQATAMITLTGSKGDTIYDQSARLQFINGSGASKLVAGNGSVLVQAGAGGGTYTAGTGGNSQLIAGTGVVTFYGSANGDVLTAAGSGADKLIAGAGAETLAGGTSIGSIILQAGSGADVMTSGLGQTTFIVGKGNSSIGISGQSDIVQVTNGLGGGFDTVSGFRSGTDHLHLAGFAASAASSAIAGQQSDGNGGVTLTFSDHTRLDMLKIGSIGQNNFA